MKIQTGLPPNIDSIRAAGLSDENSIFCYGDTLYVPHGKEVPADIQFHEQIHEQQQKVFSSPEFWWQKYIVDKGFRLEEELKAYVAQFQFVKRFYKDKEQKEALDEFATNLSGPMYKIDLTFHKARTLIRHRAKEAIH